MSDAATPTRIIRKKTGNYLEDFEPDQIFRHKGGKTITDGLFATFTEFAMTTHPLAKNARYARAYGFEGLVCPAGLVMLVAFSQTVEDISENARANLEYIDMRFGAPVYIGDTIEVETKVLGVRPSSSRPNLGIVHVQSTARKNIGDTSEAIVATWQRKVQVYKADESAEISGFQNEADEIACELWLPAYEPSAKLGELAHLSSMTAILDNTSQVHCNQYMIDLDPEQYVGGQLIVFGGIPLTLCLGLSCPDIGDNALGDTVYTTGRHTAPLHAGDTVFAATEVLGRRDHPEREDLGIVETRLFGYKFVRAEGEIHDDAPEGWKRVQIFELDRQLAVKRRSHYV